jgi:hypothetical protein
MKKIIIGDAVKGSIEMPETPNAYKIFYAVRKAYEAKKPVTLSLLFSNEKIASLGHYQKGGAQNELSELALFIAMGKVLGFDTSGAEALKLQIELTNDNAHVRLNISKRLKLLNKRRRGRTRRTYLFWDIENFSSVGPMFTHVIEKFRVPDAHIYLAANPDSLYLKRREWEADLYDYGKRLESFNFTVCDHGNNVADDVLVGEFDALRLRHSDVFIMTYDRELKERFKAACHISNNLYTLGK